MPEDLKIKVKEYWDTVPCGTGNIEYSENSIEYYNAISKNRYKIEYFIPEFAEFEKWKNKKVLEVGCGAGSDLLEFAKAGANITGIDLSSKSVELVRKRLALHKSWEVKEADAENLPFKDNTFDMTYSFGVLHHTPNMQKAINEIHRVLKPNGEIRVMLYHKPSIVCLQMWVLYGLLAGQPFRKLDDIFFYHHESIGTKVLTVNETKKLFKDFRELSVKTIKSTYDIRYARDKYLPSWFLHLVPSYLGWNILIKGKK